MSITLMQLQRLRRQIPKRFQRLRQQIRQRIPRKKRVLVRGAAGALIACSGLGLWANLWIDHKASDFIFRHVDDTPSKHTAIVLGARVHPDGTPSVTLKDRLQTALDLYRAGKVEKILVSGDHSAPEYDEVNAMWSWLKGRRVPPEDVFLDHAGLRTLDTMLRAKMVFQVNDAIVCTQHFHLSRSVFLARRAGIDAVGLAADRRRYTHHNKNLIRESVAKGVSFLDSYILRTGSRFRGEAISIRGDGRATHDRWSR